MDTMVIADFTGTMDAVVIAHFARPVYPMIIPRLGMSAIAPGGRRVPGVS
jgi:hypothetical protein